MGIVFLLAALVVGRFVRPQNPQPEKLETYECGEPAVGTSFVQFDLRFYVVALLFIIFDVEVAFFFPWATVFGKATHLSDRAPSAAVVAVVDGATRADSAGQGLVSGIGCSRARRCRRRCRPVCVAVIDAAAPEVARDRRDRPRRCTAAGAGHAHRHRRVLCRPVGGLRLRVASRGSRLGAGLYPPR